MAARHSLQKALALLDLFSETQPEWTPEAMIAATGYARPTLYRYLRTLREAGLVTSLPETGYTLGPRVVELDYLLRRSDPLLAAGAPALAALAGRWPCTALLVRWYGSRLLCVASECSAPDPVSSYARGRPMPLRRGAISRAILAFLPRRQIGQHVAGGLADFAALGLGETHAAVVETLRGIRRAGYAVAHGEVTPGVTGIAAPVFDSARTPIAALCVTLARGLLDEHATREAGAHVAALAVDLGNRLGARRATDRPMTTEAES